MLGVDYGQFMILYYTPKIKKENIKPFFHIILGILWWILDDDKGVEDYYKGLYEVLYYSRR